MQAAIELWKGLLHGARHERGKALAQVAPCDAARVGGLHLLARAAGAMRQEVADGLRGRLIRFAASGDGGSVGRLFHLALQLDARKRVFAVEILGAYADQQRAVGVLPVARKAAHAVDHHAFRLAGGAHHFPTWAHAERVHAAALFFAFLRAQMHRQLVVGGAERRMAGGLPVLRTVDELLRMLDAHAHGERLLLHVHASVAHELERVAGRMTARQHHAACGDRLGGGFESGGVRTVSATSPKRLGGLEAGYLGLG